MRISVFPRKLPIWPRSCTPGPYLTKGVVLPVRDPTKRQGGVQLRESGSAQQCNCWASWKGFRSSEPNRISVGRRALPLVITLVGLQVQAWPPTFTSRDGAEMVLIPEGEFVMGSFGEEGFRDERPAHHARVKAFYIDRFEISNRLYASFDPDHPFAAGEENLPVVMVSWEDAARYANWAGKRLPTEAEWEYAATGGDGRRFPWGEKWEPAYLNWNEKGRSDGFEGLAPVDSFPDGVSPFGVFNLSGNAMEWVADWVGTYPLELEIHPTGPSEGSRKVLRGGAWLIALPTMLRCRYREARVPRHRSDMFGFRCAVDPETAYPGFSDGSSRTSPETSASGSN